MVNPGDCLHYSTVNSVAHEPYRGTVYNLSVADDNSYTVNGVVVHNCLCYMISVTQSVNDFTSQLRGWMRGEESWPAMDEYARTYEPVLSMPNRLIAQSSAVAAAAGAAGAFIQGALWDWLDGDEETLDERMAQSGSAMDEWQ